MAIHDGTIKVHGDQDQAPGGPQEGKAGTAELGELIIQFEGISPLTGQAIVTIVALGQVKPTVILGGSFAVQAMADRLRKMFYKPSPN